MSETTGENTAAHRTLPTWIVTLVCALLLATHLWLRLSHGNSGEGLDAIALGLAVVGLSPWIATIIKTLKFGGFEVRFQEWVEEKVEAQGSDIEQLKFLITHFLPFWEIEHLKNLLGEEPFEMDLDHLPRRFEDEVRHLRHLGFLDTIDGKSTSDWLRSQPRKRDLRRDLKVTEAGKRYLEYREGKVLNRAA
ncbi:MAG: hypothetical protein JOY83_01905 [Alphaproteobacteria bacterium]|nr:hypothetical protein [Alphaproteobacteria bacterium]